MSYIILQNMIIEYDHMLFCTNLLGCRNQVKKLKEKGGRAFCHLEFKRMMPQINCAKCEIPLRVLIAKKKKTFCRGWVIGREIVYFWVSVI